MNPNSEYAWRTLANVYTTLGENEIESDLWNFVIAGSNVQNPEVTNINNFLENLNNSGFVNLEELGLQGFTPTGQVYINGELVNIENLMELLNNILGGEEQIENIVIEP